MFFDVSCRLNRETEKMGLSIMAEFQLDLRPSTETKDMKKMMLLHQEHHPKDASRCS